METFCQILFTKIVVREWEFSQEHTQLPIRSHGRSDKQRQLFLLSFFLSDPLPPFPKLLNSVLFSDGVLFMNVFVSYISYDLVFHSLISYGTFTSNREDTENQILTKYVS